MAASGKGRILVVEGQCLTVADPPRLKPRTLAAQALRRVEETTGGVVPPIHVATTYLRDPNNTYSRGYTYARPDNATVWHAEALIAALEEAAGALLFASGMGGRSRRCSWGCPKARVVIKDHVHR